MFNIKAADLNYLVQGSNHTEPFHSGRLSCKKVVFVLDLLLEWSFTSMEVSVLQVLDLA